MALISITPRLNFHFTMSDLMVAMKGIFVRNSAETGLKKYFPESDIYFTNHARTGLRLLLNSLDLPKSSKVGVLVYNCLTVFESITLAGYKPVFIDVTKDYRLNISDLKLKGPDLDAIIVTHLFGIPSDMDEIKAIMGSKPIIEDCAHSFLDKYQEKYLGSYGVGSVFSFGHAKFPAAVEGGIVLINDCNMNSRYLQNHQQLKRESKFKHVVSVLKAIVIATSMKRFIYGYITRPLKQKIGGKIDPNNKYVFKERTCNSGFKEVFERRLLRINDYKNAQIKNSIFIMDCFKLDYHIPLTIRGQANFMVPISTDNSKGILKLALERGIEFGQHFNNSIVWAKKYDYFNGNCPIAEDLIKSTITAPCHYRLSEDDLKRIKSVASLHSTKI